MTEPRHAYVATEKPLETIKERGGLQIGSSDPYELFLNPTQALATAFSFIADVASHPDDWDVYLYQIDLTQLDGVWPRVRYGLYNSIELRWSCGYIGVIPASVIKLVNSITRKQWLKAETPPTTKADGEEAGVI